MAAQQLPASVCNRIGEYLETIGRREIALKNPIKIISTRVVEKKIILNAGIDCSYIPFREDNVAEIYKGIKQLLPTKYANHKIEIITNKRTIESLIPPPLRTRKTAEGKLFAPTPVTPLVTNISKPYRPTQGLHCRHIALWQSHGLYYNQKKPRWEWQRGRLFETIETTQIGRASCRERV